MLERYDVSMSDKGTPEVTAMLTVGKNALL